MDFQTLFNAAIGFVLMLSGWVLRTVWDAVTSLRKDLMDIEREMHSTYIRRDDYRTDMAEIKQYLHLIFERLDHKADK